MSSEEWSLGLHSYDELDKPPLDDIKFLRACLEEERETNEALAQESRRVSEELKTVIAQRKIYEHWLADKVIELQGAVQEMLRRCMFKEARAAIDEIEEIERKFKEVQEVSDV